jgi:hypothetical protein
MPEQDCARPFYVTEVGGHMPGTKEPDTISCPHCYGEWGKESSNGAFQTAKLSSEAEKKWYEDNSSA